MAVKKAKRRTKSKEETFKQDMLTHEHDPFKIRRPFKQRSPRTDLIILVAIIAIFALVIMFLKYPR